MTPEAERKSQSKFPGDGQVEFPHHRHVPIQGRVEFRGYINDPQRTAAAFMTDPHRPGRQFVLREVEPRVAL